MLATTERRWSIADLAVLAAFAGAGWGASACLWVWFKDAEAEKLTIVLTNTATVGGIVAGLSLAGLGALSLSGVALARLREHYGSYIRAILLGSYGLAAVLALTAGVLAAFPELTVARVIAAMTPPLLVVVLLASTYIVTSLYRLGEWTPDPPSRPRPLPNLPPPD